MNEWTIEKVKEELPDVNVATRFGVYIGKTVGRKMEFPLVHVDFGNWGTHYQFSWQAIVNSLNSGQPLIV